MRLTPKITIALAVMQLAAPLGAKTSEPIPLAKQGPWEINYDIDACHLIAKFGGEGNWIIARFSRFAPGDLFYLDLFGQRLSASNLQSAVTIDFGPVVDRRRIEAMAGTSGKIPMLKLGGMLLADNPAAAPEETDQPALGRDQEAAVTWLDLGLRARTYRLELGAMDKPMEALRTCNADLIKFWGYAPAEQATLSRRATPIGTPGNWLTSSDYPSAAISGGRSAVLQVRLEVDESGAVSGCHIQLQTRGDDFARQTCALITRRAKFLPALDKDGKPIRSFYVSAVRWVASQG